MLHSPIKPVIVPAISATPEMRNIFGIVSGVSGATLGDSKVVLLAGLAGMIASALSMGSGAYLAAKSEREIFEAELQREREALKSDPEEAREEMAIFYQLKGVPEDDAAKIADYLAANPEQFLRTMATEKLNLSEDALSHPITSALSGPVHHRYGSPRLVQSVTVVHLLINGV